MSEESSGAKDPGKKAGRGVSYPVMGLEEAIEKARAFHREERQSSAPVAAAIKHFGYAESSSGGRQLVATLIQFGLLQDEGRSENRYVKLTDRALTILLDEPQSAERIAALKECATMPRLYGLILSKYPGDLPSDHSLGFYLQKEFDFNPKTLKAFIEDFRGTMSFANVLSGAKIPPAAPNKPAATEGTVGKPLEELKQIDVGDLIQWESNGVLKMESPRRVRGKDEAMGGWLFVDGSTTGIPMSEALLIEKAGASSPARPLGPPPTMALSTSAQMASMGVDEEELFRGKFGKSGSSYRLLATGKIGSKELGKIIKLLEAHKAAYEDEDDDTQ